MTVAIGRLARIRNAARDSFAGLLAPTFCPICDTVSTDSPICPDCRTEMSDTGPVCPRCAMPVGPWANLDGGCHECRGQALGFDAAITLGPYSGPIRDLCLRIKHHPDAWLARWLAELLADTRLDALRAEIGDERGPLVVPVPLHWRRRLERGYNQSEALAETIARRLGLRMSQPLRRIKDTEKLAGSARSERKTRLKGAFRPRFHARLNHRTILLVDDILTTGTTCGEAARALKKAGARRVVAVVIARAEGKG